MVLLVLLMIICSIIHCPPNSVPFDILSSHFPTEHITLHISESNPSTPIGQIVIHLFRNDMPKSVDNFVTICRSDFLSKETETILSYNNVPIHSVFPDFFILTGDITNGDGSGGESIYGPYFG